MTKLAVVLPVRLTHNIHIHHTPGSAVQRAPSREEHLIIAAIVNSFVSWKNSREE